MEHEINLWRVWELGASSRWIDNFLNLKRFNSQRGVETGGANRRTRTWKNTIIIITIIPHQKTNTKAECWVFQCVQVDACKKFISAFASLPCSQQ